MEKIKLSEDFLIFDIIPYKLKIENKEYLNHIQKSFTDNNFLSNNLYHYTSIFKKLNHHHFNNWLLEYIQQHIFLFYQLKTTVHNLNCTILNKKTSTFSFHQANKYNFNNTCDYSLYYVADCDDENTEIVITYDNHKWTDMKQIVPLVCKKFLLFNSYLQHYINNKSDKKEVVLINFEMVDTKIY